MLHPELRTSNTVHRHNLASVRIKGAHGSKYVKRNVMIPQSAADHFPCRDGVQALKQAAGRLLFAANLPPTQEKSNLKPPKIHGAFERLNISSTHKLRCQNIDTSHDCEPEPVTISLQAWVHQVECEYDRNSSKERDDPAQTTKERPASAPPKGLAVRTISANIQSPPRDESLRVGPSAACHLPRRHTRNHSALRDSTAHNASEVGLPDSDLSLADFRKQQPRQHVNRNKAYSDARHKTLTFAGTRGLARYVADFTTESPDANGRDVNVGVNTRRCSSAGRVRCRYNASSELSGGPNSSVGGTPYLPVRAAHASNGPTGTTSEPFETPSSPEVCELCDGARKAFPSTYTAAGCSPPGHSPGHLAKPSRRRQLLLV
jgi:hypothetical protein